MNRNWLIGIVVVIVLSIGGFLVFGHSTTTPNAPTSGKTLQVVAAENFWGSLISQLGGTHVHVLSIVSDPNADPHEYASNTTDARAIADANYVIVNGAGYDNWMDKLLSAGGNPNRKVLQVAELLGKKEGDNPHFWYSPTYVNQVVAQMEQDLIAIDPANTDYYKQQYATVQASLAVYQNQIMSIKQNYSGISVGATEDIFVYFADATGLNLISPPTFIQAVAEGNDPPASSVVVFQNQVKSKQMKVLVYNTQTVTPLTESIKSLAGSNTIPIVGISETIQPPNVAFQDWMSAEVTALQKALQTATGK